MTSENTDPLDELESLVRGGKVSLASIEAILDVPAGRLDALLAEPSRGGMRLITEGPSPSVEDAARLSTLVGYLARGLDGRIGDDERLTAILETLTDVFHFTPENIALLAQVDPHTVRAFVDDPASVPVEARYRMGIRCSYLLSGIAQSRLL